MQRIYEEEDKSLEPWKDSPSEISKEDWRDYLGKRTYAATSAFLLPQDLTMSRFQRAYVDFFEDQLVAFGYDWRKLLEHYLYEGKEPLINSLVSGRRQPRSFPLTHTPSLPQ